MPQSGFIKRNSIGEIPKPQEWRLHDDEISTISLDLGVHLHSLLHFICNLTSKEIYAVANSFGLNKKIIDNISVALKFENGAIGNFWYSKTALGQTNGLKFRVYGTNGSLEWFQQNPDVLSYANSEGIVSTINMSDNSLLEANNSTYNRFKPGHPTGFIEALSNYYVSIYDNLSKKDCKNFTLTINEVEEGMRLMLSVQESINLKSIIKK
jgi:predicted dehydrogenase